MSSEINYTPEDTIFIQIASYGDPELQWTLKDLFEKAKKPENIFVGICHQYDMKDDEDKHLFEIPFLIQNDIEKVKDAVGLEIKFRTYGFLLKNIKWHYYV